MLCGAVCSGLLGGCGGPSRSRWRYHFSDVVVVAVRGHSTGNPRLWVELNTLHSARAAMEAGRSLPLLATRLEALRLELIVLLDHCATRWTKQLDHWQRRWLVSMINDVLAALNDSADE